MAFSVFSVALSYIITLAINKIDGKKALVTHHIMNACEEEQDNMVLATERMPDRTSQYKMERYSKWANA